MKKLILAILIGGVIMTGLSAKTAVVYFSATGTTAKMAKSVATEMGVDIFEIQPVHIYTKADLNWHNKKSLTTIECNDPNARPEIANNIAITSDSGNQTLTATLADNSSAKAFYELLQKSPVEVEMHDYGSFEKAGPLPKLLPRNDTKITTCTAQSCILY